MATAGVIGLGYDLLPANRNSLNAQGGHSRASARAVALEAAVVITSLPHAKALEEVLFDDEGIASAGRPGILVVETSTLSLDVKERSRDRLAATGLPCWMPQ